LIALFSRWQGAGADTIALQGLQPADGQPARAAIRTFKLFQHPLFVIALEQMGLKAVQMALDDPIDEGAAIGAPVDIIAEIDGYSDRRARGIRIRLNFVFQLLQKIEAAMHIADGINARAFGRIGLVAMAHFCFRSPANQKSVTWLIGL
jgi:hypothetical protein